MTLKYSKAFIHCKYFKILLVLNVSLKDKTLVLEYYELFCVRVSFLKADVCRLCKILHGECTLI